METFDNLSLEEKIKTVNEFAGKFAEAAKPVIESYIKMMHELSKAAALAVYGVENFQRRYMAEVKKERHRKRYYRMMARINRRKQWI